MTRAPSGRRWAPRWPMARQDSMLGRAGRQGCAVGRGCAYGWGPPDDHGSDRFGHLGGGSARAVELFLGEAGLVDQAYSTGLGVPLHRWHLVRVKRRTTRPKSLTGWPGGTCGG